MRLSANVFPFRGALTRILALSGTRPGDANLFLNAVLRRNQCVMANAVFVATKGVDSSSCGHPMIYGADGTAITATAAVSTDKTGIVLTAASAPAGFKPIATSYGRGSWAVTTFYNSAGPPVLPWYANITATELPMDFGWAQDAVGASQRWDGAGLPAVSYSP